MATAVPRRAKLIEGKLCFPDAGERIELFEVDCNVPPPPEKVTPAPPTPPPRPIDPGCFLPIIEPENPETCVDAGVNMPYKHLCEPPGYVLNTQTVSRDGQLVKVYDEGRHGIPEDPNDALIISVEELETEFLYLVHHTMDRLFGSGFPDYSWFVATGSPTEFNAYPTLKDKLTVVMQAGGFLNKQLVIVMDVQPANDTNCEPKITIVPYLRKQVFSLNPDIMTSAVTIKFVAGPFEAEL